jgi:hypothetical protein
VEEWPLAEMRPPALTAVGRIRIDLPRYRIRGICRVEYDGEDAMSIDFKHSSLFGAYEEDALILLRGDELVIMDRERNRTFDTDSSVAIIARGVGFDIQADDLLYALLFALPACPEIEGPEYSADGAGWSLAGVWRGRSIELEGSDGGAVEAFSFCPIDKNNCYRMSYKYDSDSVYPERIVLVRRGGRERITFDIVDCRY